ncbi:MAG: H-X9-DG-CTERM domain-containing protein [Cumulibacter sp.]
MDNLKSVSVNRYLYPNHPTYPLAERHAGGANYLFLDGHVENLKAEFLHTSEGQILFRKTKGISIGVSAYRE